MNDLLLEGLTLVNLAVIHKNILFLRGVTYGAFGMYLHPRDIYIKVSIYRTKEHVWLKFVQTEQQTLMALDIRPRSWFNVTLQYSTTEKLN